MADGVAGGLVARDHQQDEEGRDLRRRQLFTVHLGLHQAGGQIGARAAAPVLGERMGVVARILVAFDEVAEVRVQVRIAVAEDDVGPSEDLVVVFLGNAHHVADHLQREADRPLGDQVAVPSGWSATMAETSRRARSRTESTMRANTLGVNARFTIARSR